MRDIRPGKRRDEDVFPEDLPVDAKELYRRHAPKQRPAKFSGARVPVSSVQHIPPVPIPKKSSIKASGPRMRVGQRERTALTVLAGLVLAVGALAAFIFLPKADIDLVLQTAPLLVDQELTIRAEPSSSADIIAGNIHEKTVHVEGVTPVATRELIGEKAHGTVQIVNRTTEIQRIKEQSRLVTKDGTLFYMKSHAIVPAASGNTPSRVSVDVEAGEAGPKGNIAPGRLDFAALDTGAQSVVYAEATQAFTGGSGTEIPVVREGDLKQAQDAAGLAARQQVESEIRSQLPRGWAILEESWVSQAETFETDAEDGQQRDAIPYKADMNVRVISYEESVLQERLTSALEARLDAEYMLFPGPISYTKAVESVDWEKGEAIVTARVTHTTVPAFSQESLQEKLAGRTKVEAQAYLEGLRGVESVAIELWPLWVQRIPNLDARIHVNIRSNRTES